MHSCSEVPDAKKAEDEGCLDTLTKNYAFVYRVGNKESVSASFVFKLSRETQDVAIKVVPLTGEGALSDTRIACLLNGLDEETPVFVKTFGWIKCSAIPSRWLQRVDMKKDVPLVFKPMLSPSSGVGKHVYIFQIMAFSSHAWEDERIQLGLEEYRAMLFLLMHGLWLARTRHGFRHNDVHAGQVLFQVCQPNTRIAIRVGDKTYTVVCERFVPKLIDFGLATLRGSAAENEKSPGGGDSEDESDCDSAPFGGGSGSDDDMFDRSDEADEYDDDLVNLLEIFSQRMQRDKLKPFAFSTPKAQRTLASMLMGDAVFAIFRVPYGNAALLRCDVCSSSATKQWEGVGVRFCGDACAHSWRGIQELY